jgi:hypothetical protein
VGIRAAAFSQICAGVSQDHAPPGRAETEETVMRGGGIVGVVVLVWLLIGVIAAYQRDYFKTSENNCGTAGTIALTVVAGPLNYGGVNPKVTDCKLPQPTQ